MKEYSESKCELVLAMQNISDTMRIIPHTMWNILKQYRLILKQSGDRMKQFSQSFKQYILFRIQSTLLANQLSLYSQNHGLKLNLLSDFRSKLSIKLTFR